MIRFKTELGLSETEEILKKLQEDPAGEVKIVNQNGDTFLRIENGKNTYLWKLTLKEGEITGKRELTISLGMALLRMSFYVIALLTVTALLVYFSLHHQVTGVLVCAIVGLIPLWTFAISVALHILMPKKLAQIYFKRRFSDTEQKQ